MYYKLVTTQVENKKVVDVNITMGLEPCQVLKQLAICYRDANKKTCENGRVKSCKAWATIGVDGLHVQKFRFICSGWAPGIEYQYEYEFSGCGL